MTRTFAAVPTSFIVSLAAGAVLVVLGLGLQLCRLLGWNTPAALLLGLVFVYAIYGIIRACMRDDGSLSSITAGPFAPKWFQRWLVLSGVAFVLAAGFGPLTLLTGVWLWGFVLSAAGVGYAALDIGVDLLREARRRRSAVDPR